MDEFPKNSTTSKRAEHAPLKNTENKKIERVATGEVVRRKKPLGKRMTEVFIGGDTKGVMGFVAMDVLVPAAKDMISDALTTAVERMLFGESRGSHRRSSGGSPFGTGARRGEGSNGYVSYNRFSPNSAGRDSRPISKRGRANHDFDEIILATRVEADEVIDRLFELLQKYEMASVADLYSLVGIESNYTDNKWGWTDIRGTSVVRVRDGYLLDLPRPEAID